MTGPNISWIKDDHRPQSISHIFCDCHGLVDTVGFFRTFYARPFFELPPLRAMVILHSVVFTAWVLLFLVQVRLIATGRVKLHMTLGVFGAVLGFVAVVVGIIPAMEVAGGSARRPIMGLTTQQFLLVPIFSVGTFALFFASAMVLRRKAAHHKRLMMLAMISVLGPAIFRVMKLINGAGHFVAIQMAVAAALLLWCLVHDWRKHHLIHPIYAVGGTLPVLSWPLRMALAGTGVWTGMAAWLLRSPGV